MIMELWYLIIKIKKQIKENKMIDWKEIAEDRLKGITELESMVVSLEKIIKNQEDFIDTLLADKDYIPDPDVPKDWANFQFYAVKNVSEITYPNFKEYRNKKIV